MTQNYGTPLDPAKAPPPPAPPVVPSPRAGVPAPAYPQPSEQQKTFVTVSLDATRPPSNLPPGVMPQVINWSVTPEGLRPRLGYEQVGPSGLSSSHSVLGKAVGSGYLHSYQDVFLASSASLLNQDVSVMAFSDKTPAYWTGSHWSALTSQTTTLFNALRVPIDSVTAYDPVGDLNAVVWTSGGEGASAERPYIWRGPNATTSGATYYSWLTTGAASAITGAMAVGYFDTRLVFANMIVGAQQRIPQRIMWSERGSLETFVEPTGGTEDLVSMRGGIVRIVDDGDRMILIGEQEVWAGYKANFPFDFQFTPLDRTMGTYDARTVIRTPIGIMFQGYDFNVYLLPKGSSSLVAIGGPVRRDILAQQNNNLTRAYHSFAVYDPIRAEYRLFPATDNAAGVSLQPRVGFAFNIQTQAWSTVSSGRNLGHAIMHPVDSPDDGLGPTVWYITSGYTVARGVEQWNNARSRTSASTVDLGSAFIANAILPIGNPNPQRKLYVRDLLIDYSNSSCPSGSSISIGLSSDFGQTIDRTIGVALPFTTISRQTVVNVGYSAIYPSIDVQYISQVSGNFLRIQKLTALVEDIGQPGVGNA